MKLNPLEDYKSKLDEELEEEMWAWIKVLAKVAIGLIGILVGIYAMPWEALLNVLVSNYSIQLLAILFCGFCAGLIFAMLIQEWRKNKRRY